MTVPDFLATAVRLEEGRGMVVVLSMSVYC